MVAPRKGKNGIDLGLAVIEAVRRPGEALSQQSIAEVCGVSKQTIQQIETKAMAKLRARLRELEALIDQPTSFIL
jgi:DNA-directed RNA polymerase sigma subunit (sigma70/sigma32)